jgi:UDP-N-acetylmuramoyl-L-alanyl-D-glutamate--2,6-diaminopimelate ligase
LLVVNTTMLQAAEIQGVVRQFCNGITTDSRQVQPGMLFFAIPGAKDDGGTYIADAISRGAAAIVVPESSAFTYSGVPILTSPHIRRSVALLARQLYPRQPETLVAVTGTNGKSSVVHFCQQLWQHEGINSASIGTVGVITKDRFMPGSLTTPDALELMKTLDQLAKEGITHAALEASSHGLDQERLTGVVLKAAAFLNLTRDHLDYHGTMEAYAAAKLRIFQELLPEGGAAVLNIDAAYADAAKAIIVKRRQKLIVVSARQAADIQLIKLMPRLAGTGVELRWWGEKVTFETPIVGGFQIENMLAALGLVVGGGMVLNAVEVARLVPLLGAVRGRLERVSPNDSDIAVYVDYAHTPDGLETALKALRPHTKGKLFVVFGCGGNRDAGKRPLMGAIAQRCADVVLVTDDNPRFEDAAAIRAAIVAAVPAAQNIGDRGLAIAAAVNQAGPGDTILLAGKGHEKTQIIGNTAVPFSDQETVQRLFTSGA